jgi:hypothetical protein
VPGYPFPEMIVLTLRGDVRHIEEKVAELKLNDEFPSVSIVLAPVD